MSSTQRSLYKDYANLTPRLPPATSNPTDDSQNEEQKSNQKNKKISQIQTPQSDNKYKQIATTIRMLPEMPESAKNIAKNYMENKLGNVDPHKIPSIIAKEEKRYENLGSKLLSGIKSLGQNKQGSLSQLSRNTLNVTEQLSNPLVSKSSINSTLIAGQNGLNNKTVVPSIHNINNINGLSNMNRSFSLKSLNKNMSQKSIKNLNYVEEEEDNNLTQQQQQPNIGARIKEITDDHLSNKNLMKVYPKSIQGSHLNLGQLKNFNKNIIITQSQVGLHMHKLSPLPERYQQHLPNIIQQSINEGPASVTSVNFKQNMTAFQSKKRSMDLKSLENLQNLMRQDVSYLGELKSKDVQASTNQPTVLTTGNRAQDELLETTLGMKNMGKSLLDLPQTIEELRDIFQLYEQKLNKQGGYSLRRRENEEDNLDKYIQENFLPLDSIQESDGQDNNYIEEIQLPGLTLQQFNQNQQFQSKFLSNQVQQSKLKNLQSSPFNIHDKSKNSYQYKLNNSTSPQLASLEKQPPKVDTRPDKLILVDDNLIKNFGKEAFYNKKPSVHKLLTENSITTSTDIKDLQDKKTKKLQKLTLHNKTLPFNKSSQNISMSKNFEQLLQNQQQNLLNVSNQGKMMMFQQQQNNNNNSSLQMSGLMNEGDKSQDRSLSNNKQMNTLRNERHMINNSLSPINIKTHKQISNNTLITQIVQSNNSGNYGNPSSRQDAILLIVWFEKMLQLIQQDFQKSHPQNPNLSTSNLNQNTNNTGTTNSNSQDESRQYKLLQLVMNICVKELSRQVSVQCVERGLIMQRVFQSYAKLIELINKDNKEKRYKFKRELADKLDRYINIQEGQIRQFQNKIAQQNEKERVMMIDLDDCLTKLNQANVLISKFKKKCWNAQKDLEGATRNLKYLDRENKVLKAKVQELNEKLGDGELSDIDDSDRRRMLQQIDEEMYLQRKDKLEYTQNDGEVMEDAVDIDQIPDRDVIKEDDKATSMLDFEAYLRSINAWKYRENESQTDKVFKKHVKVGVKPEKLGILKDKETFIDARMFYGDNQNAVQLRLGGNGTVEFEQVNGIKIEDQEQNLQEDYNEDSELFSDDDSNLEAGGFKGRQESSLDNDETLKELGIIMEDNMTGREGGGGFISIDVSQIKQQRKTSLPGDFNMEDLDENDLKDLPQYGTQQAHHILSVSPLQNPKIRTDESFFAKRQRMKPNQRNVGIGGNNSYRGSIKAYDDDIQQDDQEEVKQQLPQNKRKNTLMQLFAERIKQRLKDLMNSEQLEKIKQTDENFASKLFQELKNTQIEVKEMNKEIHKKERQVRFSQKLNFKNERDLKEAEQMLDHLEMENYNLREQLNDVIKYFEEYEQMIQDLLKLLEGRDSMGQLSINDLRNKLMNLSSKIGLARQKSLQQLNEDDAAAVTNNQYATSVGILENQSQMMEGQEMGEDQTSSYNQTANNFNQKSIAGGTNQRGIQSSSKPRQKNKNQTSFAVAATLNDKSDQKQSQEIIRKKAQTRFQMFNIGKRKTQSKSKGAHPSIILLRKLQQKKKIKDIMPRKMLLRAIFQIYQEHGPFDLNSLSQPQQPLNIVNQANNITSVNNNNTNTIQQNLGQNLNLEVKVGILGETKTSFNVNSTAAANNNNQVPLAEWVYENFMQKYGLKNVAEKKFCQLIGSCIINKDLSPRIRLFGRFFEIYNELSASDYNRYLEMVDLFQSQVLNFKIDDDLETILLPASRAFDYYKLKFESKYTQQNFVKRLHHIEKMKVPVSSEEQKTQKHLKNVREAVDFDAFIEFVLDSYSKLQEERDNQIRDIYLAADLNGDGLLSGSEFMTLMKVFHYKSENDIQKLFEDYASNNQEGSYNKSIKYLNLDQFIVLCTNKDYFSARVQTNFAKSKNVDKDFVMITEQLPRLVLLFKERLREVQMQDDFESLELIENFQNSVKFPFSNRVGWLCFRIVDDSLKRLYLKKLSENYMPISLKNTGFKLRPQPSLFNMLPVNLFDTL